jgi:hypothetical protein
VRPNVLSLLVNGSYPYLFVLEQMRFEADRLSKEA